MSWLLNNPVVGFWAFIIMALLMFAFFIFRLVTSWGSIKEDRPQYAQLMQKIKLMDDNEIENLEKYINSNSFKLDVDKVTVHKGG